MVAAEARERVGSSYISRHVFGMRRVGNHAVTGWLLAGLESAGEQVGYFNAVSMNDHPKRRPQNIHRAMTEQAARVAVLSYEDESYAARFDLRHYRIFAEADSPDIRLLRSFHNMFASRYQRGENVRQQGRTSDSLRTSWAGVRQLWLETAWDLAAAQETEEYVGVLYDRWFQDREYRDSLGNTLGFVNQDLALERVAPNGGGSSDDGMEYDGRAQEMNVLGRFQALMERDPAARQVFGQLINREVLMVNEHLFGKDPYLHSVASELNAS
jgi:hypothetical protein